MKFLAKIEKSKPGIDAAFIRIPFDVSKVFGKIRVKVKVLFDGVEYRGTIAIMNKNIGPILGLRKDIREKIGKSFGDSVEVILEEDTKKREVEIPADFQKAIDKVPGAKNKFENLSYTHRKEYINWISEVKKRETRERRILKALEMINQGK